MAEPATNEKKKEKIGAEDLGIDLADNSDTEAFRWLVACLLFAARINSKIAAEAFRALDKDKILTPRKLAKAEWQHLVDLLGEVGYRRYDESKARELIKIGQDVLRRYQGKLTKLPEGATSSNEISKRLQEFTGIGPTATGIFLRDVGPAWTVDGASIGPST
jgi:endonuclease III